MKTLEELQNTVANTPERVDYLKDVIQRNYDNDNWYGYDSKRSLLTIAATLELLSYHIIFEPTYNCPA